jgi:multiple sugar transport system permease protein
MKNNMSLGRLARVVTMSFVAVLFVLPIVGFLAVAMGDQDALVARESGFLGLGGMSLANAQESWSELLRYGSGDGGIFLRWFTNSVVISVAAGLLAIVTTMPAGYVLARLRFSGRKSVLMLALISMAMPNTVLVIPIFLQVNAVGAVGEIWPLMVIMGFFPFGVYLAYIHFMTAMPHELVEAGRVDGLGEIAIFLRIGLPISKQAVALVAFFSFVANWTNFFLPLTLLTSSATNKTLSIGLQELIGSSPLFNPTTAAGLSVQLWLPELALAAFVSMLPLLIVFLTAQRYLLKGQTVGAVKG